MVSEQAATICVCAQPPADRIRTGENMQLARGALRHRSSLRRGPALKLRMSAQYLSKCGQLLGLHAVVFSA